MVYECGDTETTTKAVKYSVFVPILIKAMQELKANNDALQARIETLENN
jgi:cell division protein FtsB